MASLGHHIQAARDHGGGIDAARARYGGAREDWIDLSTGINPVPFHFGPPPIAAWAQLPDQTALDALTDAARRLWQVPKDMAILAAPGASALIAHIPDQAPAGRVWIPGPTYNEHAAAFARFGFEIDGGETGSDCTAQVLVHPNNPTGRVWSDAALRRDCVTVIDESFCDACPEHTLLPAVHNQKADAVLLKSLGKFWGLAGLRLGFAIGWPDRIAALADALGPWAVSGPAIDIGRAALADTAWQDDTRQRLISEADRLDVLIGRTGAALVGGTPLFRLYDVGDAAAWQDRLAHAHILTRRFPYHAGWLRLGLPGPTDWDRLARAL